MQMLIILSFGGSRVLSSVLGPGSVCGRVSAVILWALEEHEE